MREFRIPPVKKRLITPLQAQDTLQAYAFPREMAPQKGVVPSGACHRHRLAEQKGGKQGLRRLPERAEGAAKFS
jgi:hypothetical protein